MHFLHEIGLLGGEVFLSHNVLQVDLVENLHSLAGLVALGHLVRLHILGKRVGLDGEGGDIAHMHHDETLVEAAVEAGSSLRDARGLTLGGEKLHRVEAHSHLTHQHITLLHLLTVLVLLLELVIQTVVGGFETGHLASVAGEKHCRCGRKGDHLETFFHFVIKYYYFINYFLVLPF